MSSEIAVDPVKRKTEDEDSIAKKLKSSNESGLEMIDRAAVLLNRARKPKKVILLLCYLGKEYYGMQRNSNVSTVEEELLKAMLEANVIIKSEYDFPKTMKFQRAARTDKGVSAATQLVSLKIPLNEISEALPEKLNKHLPPEIKVIAVKRVTQSFDAKIACDARTYSYMLPSFAFSPKEEESLEEYRITNERLQEVNLFLTNYVGTHNFYNFTSGRLPGDPSCKRFILSIECGPPFESHGLEFHVIKIKGQSFMLHQIRKMVGLAIAIMRNLTDASVLNRTWSSERIDIPKAPGLGLVLEEVHYDWYNSKYGSDGMHEPLKWDEYRDVIEAFKKEQICANIAKTEREEKSMLQWLLTLPHHSYDVRDCGPPTKLPSLLENENSDESTDAKLDETSLPSADTLKENCNLISESVSDICTNY